MPQKAAEFSTDSKLTGPTASPSAAFQEEQDPPCGVDDRLEFSFGHHSRAGVKENNDDTVAAHIPPTPFLTTKGAVFLIADGLSSAEKGKEASQICATDFTQEYYHTPELWSVKTSTHNTLIALNRKLYARNHAYTDPARGYASTLSLVIIKSHTAHIFHVGDSRVYRIRDGEIEQLTEDHAENKTNILTRAMGIELTLQIDYRTVEIEQGDVFLLSTDGIHDFLDPDTMSKALMTEEQNLERICSNLADLALRADSQDNLSCQIFRIDSVSGRKNDDLQNLISHLPFPPPLSPKQKLDGYRVIKEIYVSSRTQVYLVVDEYSGEQLVMKTPSLNYQDDPAYIDRFSIEEWVGRRIDSDHVVRVVPS